MAVTAETVLDEVNRRHGTQWRLQSRLVGGYQSGAYLLSDEDGRPAVLKWSAARSWAPTVLAAAPVVASARADGWPTPAWLAVGCTTSGLPYQVQEFVEGSTQELITHDWLDLILPVVAAQAGLGSDGMRNWSAYDQRVVCGPSHGNRVALERSGRSGASVVEVITRITRGYADVTLSVEDLVHGDLNPENVLITNAGAVVLIDVEAVGRGSRLHDLTTLLLYATLWGDTGVRDRLVRECRAVAAAGWMEISLGAVAVDLLAFGVQHWPADDLATACEQTTDLLRGL